MAVDVDAASIIADFAPAKINLSLHVVGRRADGYHELDSLVVFADVGDRLTLEPGGELQIAVQGPTAVAAGPDEDNLVIKAARLLAARVDRLKTGRFTLDKQLPVAAGIGGGSSDAAAALRLLAQINELSLDDPRLREAAKLTGADVPVCLNPRPRVMRGIGELLSPPIELPKLPAVLINPRVAVPTKDVFKLLAAPPVPEGHSAARPWPEFARDVSSVVSTLREQRNDLEGPAVALQPVIADVLSALHASTACLLARMSGSGATCLGLFDSVSGAQAAARDISARQPGWWVQAVSLG
jgi:4-diphosphocytidyl-2-C-methyl-D-erythritol kinase